MAQRMTLLAAVAGLTAVLYGLFPAASNRIDDQSNATVAANPNQTALNQTDAYEVSDTLLDVLVADFLPLIVLVLCAGAVIASTGILGRIR